MFWSACFEEEDKFGQSFVGIVGLLCDTSWYIIFELFTSALSY